MESRLDDKKWDDTVEVFTRLSKKLYRDFIEGLQKFNQQ